MRRFGFAFGDTFLDSQRRVRKTQETGKRGLTRLLAFYLVGGGILVLLVGRLMQLQLIQGQENRQRSESNRVQLARAGAPRGAIFDRNGTPLTRNVPIYKLKIEDGQWEIVTREEAEERERAGETIVEEVGREYLYGEALAHIIGYLGEVTEAELAGAQQDCLRRGVGCDLALGDVTGKLGVERAMEASLRGISGGTVIERGVDGAVVRKLAIREPQAGRDVTLTIDLGLQQLVAKTLGERKGAVVVSDPVSGEILALASGPGFDPNIFNRSTFDKLSAGKELGVNSKSIKEILDNDDKPLFNRVLAGLYPPGSVFKIVTATAGLEEGEIDEQTEIEDTGEIKIGEFRYGNWYFDQYGRTEGFLDIVGAIRRSNDIFFYKVGEKLGGEALAEWASRFGLGKLVGLNLGGEALGLVPSPEWKERVKGERWFLGNTYHFAIGQSDLQVTPLQMHQVASVVAAGGKLCRPSLVREALGVAKVPEGDCEELGISEETEELVKEGMLAACAPGGTAFVFANFSLSEASPSGEISDRDRVACKTGTAQFGDPQDRTHAWFVAFGPTEEPEILVTVLLEAAGEGSEQAAPVAKNIFSYWFHERG